MKYKIQSYCFPSKSISNTCPALCMCIYIYVAELNVK